MTDGTVCEMVTLDDTGTEYREVKALFEGTVLVTQFKSLWTSSSRKQDYQIVRIQRVQNAHLYHQYITRKKGMDQQNPSSYQNERRLFHGCPKDVAELISHQGFNRSFAGKNGNDFYNSKLNSNSWVTVCDQLSKNLSFSHILLRCCFL